jgi:Effector Associated Constant Component 1
MADAFLTVSLSADLPNGSLVQLTRDLERDLSRAGIEARSGQAPSVPGEKGEPVTLGVLTLAFVTTGAIKTLIGCLKAYISREPSLAIKVKRPDGTQVEVNARNVDAPEIGAVLKAIAGI